MGAVSNRTGKEAQIIPFKMDFKLLAMLLFTVAAAEASVISDFLRPVAYAALGDVVDSDWDKDSSVVHKEEGEEDTELVEEEAGEERAMEGAAFMHLQGQQAEMRMAGRGNQKNKGKKGKNGGRVRGRKRGNGQGRRKQGAAKRKNGNGGKRNNNNKNNNNKNKNGKNGNKGKKNNAMKEEQIVEMPVEMPLVE